MIDFTIYSKEYVRKRVITPIGVVMLYTGAVSLYLCPGGWREHFRKWHPLTWLLFVVTVIVYGLGSIREIVKDFREAKVPKPERRYSYWKAPRKGPMLLKEARKVFADRKSAIFEDNAGRRYEVSIEPTSEESEQIAIRLPDGSVKTYGDRDMAFCFLIQKCLVVRVV